MKEIKKEDIYYKIGLVLGGLTGLFWCAMIFNELVGVQRVSYVNIIQALAIGGFILVAVGVSCSRKLVGGIMLIAEAVLALSVILFYGLDYFSVPVLIIILPAPVFTAGILFIISFLKKRKKKKNKKK